MTTHTSIQGRIRQGSKLACVLLLTGCAASSPYDRAQVASELNAKAVGSLKPQADTHFALPDGVQLSDGLREEEAVAIALWNNASLQVSMTQLGVARADLTIAGAFPNPVLGLLFPESPARYEATLSLPIDLLTRNARVNVAKEEVERVAALMVAQGLDLAREVRIVHAEAVATEEKNRLLQEQLAISSDLLMIATVQFETGRLSEQTLAAQRAQYAELSILVADAQHTALALRYRLHELLGFDDAAIAKNVTLTPSAISTFTAPELTLLLQTALKVRPEIAAGEADVQRAGYQAKWERNNLLNLIAELKLVQTETGSSTAPGLQVTLPLFNQNQGGRSRATAELERAVQSLLATQQAIRREVSSSRASYTAALQAHDLLNESVLPALQSELEISRQAYALGRQSYLQMAQVQLRFLQAQARVLEAQLALHKASAQLAHSLGQPLTQLTATSAGVLSP